MSNNGPKDPKDPESVKPASWYSSVITDEGVRVSGGAALLVRIAKQGGMDAVCQKAGEAGARFALQMANNAVTDTPVVIPPFSAHARSRGQAARANFCLGVIPPKAVNDPKIIPIKAKIESANSHDAS